MKNCYWHIDTYLLMSNEKNNSFFWTKSGRSGHSVLVWTTLWPNFDKNQTKT